MLQNLIDPSIRMEQSTQAQTPLSRYSVTNDDECYWLGSRNDPEAVLEGAAMAGFVGILRQLGDLAQLAAEVFHGLHDQVTAASARSHELALRARQLEAELPLIEKHLCRQERRFLQHVVVASNMSREVDWRAHVRVQCGAVAGGRRPRYIAECIDRCRGPPELSMLDKYDADGAGACLKRYTDPSFFRTTKLLLQEITPKFRSSDNSKPPKAAHKCSKFESDASDNSSDGHLLMFRQLKYKQTNSSVVRRIKPQMHSFHDEDSSEEKAPATHHSEVNMFCSTGSPEITSTQVKDIAVNEEKTCDLDRTSSFHAWLSPDAAPTPEREKTEETSQDTTSTGFVSHIAPNGPDLVGANKSQENSKATRNGRNLVEFITSRVSSLPRKHDPLTESFRNMAKKLLQLRYDAIRDNGSYDLEPDREDHDAADKEATDNSDNKIPSKDVPDLDEVVFDNKSTEYTQQQVISEKSDEPCELACPPASIDEASGSVTNCNPKDTNLSMLVTNPVFSREITVQKSEQCHLHGLHQPIIHQEQNGCSEDTEDVTIPPLPPIPRMQWLSVKVHTGSGIASAELRTHGPNSPAIGRAAKSNSLQAVRKQKVEMIQARSQDSSCTSQTEMAETLVSNENVSADISHTDGFYRDSFLVKQPEEISHRESFRKDSASTSEGKGSVFFSAVEQLRKTSPPSVPRPKYSLLELRTAPSLIYPSRALSGERSILLEHIKNRSANLKPVPGRSSKAMANGIRQAHADDDDIGSNDYLE